MVIQWSWGCSSTYLPCYIIRLSLVWTMCANHRRNHVTRLLFLSIGKLLLSAITFRGQLLPFSMLRFAFWKSSKETNAKLNCAWINAANATPRVSLWCLTGKQPPPPGRESNTSSENLRLCLLKGVIVMFPGLLELIWLWLLDQIMASRFQSDLLHSKQKNNLWYSQHT